jgi:hypothetical protein
MYRRVTAGALVALVFISTAQAGPSCTLKHPRGYHVPHGTNKKPLKICTGGDLQSTWGTCVSRFTA